MAEPAATPVTTPLDVPTVAIDDGAPLHVPPPIPSLSVVVRPTHTLNVPVIVDGSGFTLTVAVVAQPVLVSVYVITVAPEEIPVTAPVVLPTVPTAGVLLLQVPPGVPSVSVEADPTQTFNVPVIVAGSALTVTVLIATQPAALM